MSLILDPDPAANGNQKSIDAVLTRKITEAATPGDIVKLSDGLSSPAGDPALLQIGAHELAHGSDGNLKITDAEESEKDVRVRVLDTVKTSPDVKAGTIK